MAPAAATVTPSEITRTTSTAKHQHQNSTAIDVPFIEDEENRTEFFNGLKSFLIRRYSSLTTRHRPTTRMYEKTKKN
jgi:hypothetical protein